MTLEVKKFATQGCTAAQDGPPTVPGANAMLAAALDRLTDELDLLGGQLRDVLWFSPHAADPQEKRPPEGCPLAADLSSSAWKVHDLAAKVSAIRGALQL